MASAETGNDVNSANGNNKRNRHVGNLKKEKERSRKISDGDESGESSSKRSGRTRAASSSSPEREEFERRSWECTVCTYRNPSEAFRCEVCEVRKGTSTRKPKLNSTVVEQQQTVQKFVQQQQAAMMAQVVKDKKIEKGSANGGPSGISASSPPETPSSTLSASSSTGGALGLLGISHSGCCSPSLSLSPSCSKTPPLTTARVAGHYSPSPLPFTLPSSVSPGAASQHNNNSSQVTAACTSRSPSPSSSTCTKNMLLNSADMGSVSSSKRSAKNRAFNRGALRTSLSGKGRRSAAAASSVSNNVPEISDVDQNSARTLAVTVNGITVVITDYKLRPNDIGGDERPSCSADGTALVNPKDSGKGHSDTNEHKKRVTKSKSKKSKKSRSPATSDAEHTQRVPPSVGDNPGDVGDGSSSQGGLFDKGDLCSQEIATSDPRLEHEDRSDSDRTIEKKRPAKVKVKNSRSAITADSSRKTNSGKRKTPTPMEQANGKDDSEPIPR